MKLLAVTLIMVKISIARFHPHFKPIYVPDKFWRLMWCHSVIECEGYSLTSCHYGKDLHTAPVIWTGSEEGVCLNKTHKQKKLLVFSTLVLTFSLLTVWNLFRFTYVYSVSVNRHDIKVRIFYPPLCLLTSFTAASLACCTLNLPAFPEKWLSVCSAQVIFKIFEIMVVGAYSIRHVSTFLFFFQVYDMLVQGRGICTLWNGHFPGCYSGQNPSCLRDNNA